MRKEEAVVQIRRAAIDDAAAVARVNVRSWKHAYRGILPDDFLDALDTAVSESRWHTALQSAVESRATFVAELILARVQTAAEIIGFATGGPERDGLVADGVAYDGEIYALYLAPEHQRRGIGCLLVGTTARCLIEHGMKSIVIWTLRDNLAARAFYEALGGRIVGQRITKIRGIYDRPEVAYGWPDAGFLIDRPQST